jgi:hypothetical protein
VTKNGHYAEQRKHACETRVLAHKGVQLLQCLLEKVVRIFRVPHDRTCSLRSQLSKCGNCSLVANTPPCTITGPIGDLLRLRPPTTNGPAHVAGSLLTG